MGKLPFILLTLALSTIATEAHAQSWLGEAGSLNASFGTTYAVSDTVVETEGLDIKGVPASHASFILGVDYVTPHDKLSVSASLPLMALKFDIDNSDVAVPHNPSLAVNDDGNFHFEAQDLRLMANYQLVGGDYYAIMGHLGGEIPTNNYPTVGFGAPGRGLKSALAGVSVLGLFEKWVPGLYATASYEFSYTEDNDRDPTLAKYNQDHSTAAVVLGYYVTDDIEINLGGNAVIYHGGLNFVEFGEVSQTERDYHDEVLNERVYLAGAGASYAVTESIGVNIFFRTFLGGQNTTNATLGGFGLSWSVL
tara:strand:- start:92351 stop:93274 length:924 start_codon:yes stop_codon:yes gene_type:complete